MYFHGSSKTFWCPFVVNYYHLWVEQKYIYQNNFCQFGKITCLLVENYLFRNIRESYLFEVDVPNEIGHTNLRGHLNFRAPDARTGLSSNNT